MIATLFALLATELLSDSADIKVRSGDVVNAPIYSYSPSAPATLDISMTLAEGEQFEHPGVVSFTFPSNANPPIDAIKYKRVESDGTSGELQTLSREKPFIEIKGTVSMRIVLQVKSACTMRISSPYNGADEPEAIPYFISSSTSSSNVKGGSFQVDVSPSTPFNYTASETEFFPVKYSLSTSDFVITSGGFHISQDNLVSSTSTISITPKSELARKTIIYLTVTPFVGSKPSEPKKVQITAYPHVTGWKTNLRPDGTYFLGQTLNPTFTPVAGTTDLKAEDFIDLMELVLDNQVSKANIVLNNPGEFSLAYRPRQNTVSLPEFPYKLHVLKSPSFQIVRDETKSSDNLSTALPGQVLKYKVIPQAEGFTKHEDLNQRIKVIVKSLIISEGDAHYTLDGSDSFSVKPLSPGSVSIQAVLDVSIDNQSYTYAASLDTARLHLMVRSISEFRPVSVRLVPIDEEFVKQSYGDHINKLFYVYSIRVINDLLEDGKPANKSVLVYSGSLETAVTLEQRNRETKLWSPINYQESNAEEADSGPNRYLKGILESSDFNPERAGFAYTTLAILKGSSPAISMKIPTGFDLITFKSIIYRNLNELDSKDLNYPKAGLQSVPGQYEVVVPVLEKGHYEFVAQYTVKKSGDESSPQINLVSRMVVSVVDPTKLERLFLYRPYKFDFVQGALPMMEGLSNQRQFVTILDSLGDIGTFFFTLFHSLGEAGDSLALINSLLVPKVKEIWPDRSEIHRANLLRDLMRPMEEVSYGTDLEKIVLFPKNPFRSVFKDQETRIRTIRTDDYQITIAVIEQKGSVRGTKDQPQSSGGG
ncbi:hypothetical protein IQ258_29090 [Coleofasciculus sp. LEGE 07081]|uniref:hypothetical protein n=1 Tax=Coleofasciculus sp. LEGE 07081 TaxID=2777967 RepID=UPI00187E4AFD|nr:hypothetical protein [Coleofasciculus sp. LEGE 07081]MBE9130078.1 hypothetical protein [Coleofasciculus sp. LEGE 07081]